MRMVLSILILAIAAVTTTSGAAEIDGKLLPDDYVFAGVDGRLVQTGDDKWVFEFESAMNIGEAEIKAGQTMEMLGSTTLEKMVADSKERTDARFRLWAKAAKFEGKNYLFSVYYLSLRKIDKPAEKPEKTVPDKTSQIVNAPNDVVTIPAEIVALLKTSEVLPATEAQVILQEQLQLKQDTIFANRTGRIAVKNGVYVFEADALGRGVDKFEIKLLPCQRLEDAILQMRSESNPVRFNVAGILTRYKGEQYLLLQKATRIYSYGNFGR
jgi:hypothetical protein